MTQSHLLCPTLANALFVKACMNFLFMAQGSSSLARILICLIDHLMQSLYHLLASLVPMTLHVDSIRNWHGIWKLSIQVTWSLKQSCPLRIMASMLVSPTLSKTSMFVTLSSHLVPMIDHRDVMWKCSSCLMCFVYKVHSPQPYSRLVNTTSLYTLILVVSLMFLWLISWEHGWPSDWLALLIWTSISLLGVPSEEITLPRYLKLLTDFSWVPSIFILGAVAVDPGAGWCITSVLLRLIMWPNRWEALANLLWWFKVHAPSVPWNTIISKQSLCDESL